jgi:hypothetical protein
MGNKGRAYLSVPQLATWSQQLEYRKDVYVESSRTPAAWEGSINQRSTHIEWDDRIKAESYIREDDKGVVLSFKQY